jgi:hypothetical protein
MANTADHYRRLAQECERIAHTHPPGTSSRTSLLEMARMWERLAQEAAAPMTSPRPTEAQQPVVQQQQQVQPKDKGGGIIKSPRGRDRQTTEDEFAGAKESGPPKGGPLS